MHYGSTKGKIPKPELELFFRVERQDINPLFWSLYGPPEFDSIEEAIIWKNEGSAANPKKVYRVARVSREYFYE